jgi:hypothetical protein
MLNTALVARHLRFLSRRAGPETEESPRPADCVKNTLRAALTSAPLRHQPVLDSPHQKEEP